MYFGAVKLSGHPSFFKIHCDGLLEYRECTCISILSCCLMFTSLCFFRVPGNHGDHVTTRRQLRLIFARFCNTPKSAVTKL